MDESNTPETKEYITPTGRILGLVLASPQHAHLRIAYIDGKGGQIPDKYSGLFTGRVQGERALTAFIAETFEVAAAHTKTRNKVA